MSAQVSMAQRPKVSAPLTLVYLLATLLLTLISVTGWGSLLFFNLVFAGDVETAYHQWMLMHGTDLVWGWAGVAVLGLAARQIRRGENQGGGFGWMVGIGGGLLLAGALIAGAAPAVTDPVARGWISLVGLACFLPAVVLFTLAVLSFFAAREIDIAALFVLVAIQWLLIWAGAETYVRFHARMQGEPSGVARDLLIQLPLLAFIPNLFFGLAIRLLPGLMRFARLRQRAWLVGLVGYNVGLVLIFLSVRFWQPLAVPGGVFLLSGGFLYVVGFNFFAAAGGEAKTTGRREGRGIHAFILLSFLWLLLGLAVITLQQTALALGAGEPSTILLYLRSPSLVAAWRHAVAAGFAMTLIVVVGQRMILAMLPASVATPRLFAATAVLLGLGVAWHILFQLLTLVNGVQADWAFRLLGVGACLELAAMILFGLSMFRTMAASGSLELMTSGPDAGQS